MKNKLCQIFLANYYIIKHITFSFSKISTGNKIIQFKYKSKLTLFRDKIIHYVLFYKTFSEF